MRGIGVFLLALVMILIWGNLWFHLVEAALRSVRKLLMHIQKPPAWHTFPTDKEEKGK